jgi:RNA polymerase sigma factor (TIGR02999 family)
LPEAVTPLLRDLRAGDAEATSRLFELLYADLRARAAAYVRGGGRNHSVNATGLVHEAYIKFVGAGSSPNDRGHLMAILSRSMRQILTDHARKRGRLKRLPQGERQPIDEVVAEIEDTLGDLEEIDVILRDLREIDERKARAVELRIFGGLSLEETAAALGFKDRTFDRFWRDVKLFFAVRMPGARAFMKSLGDAPVRSADDDHESDHDSDDDHDGPDATHPRSGSAQRSRARRRD